MNRFAIIDRSAIAIAISAIIVAVACAFVPLPESGGGNHTHGNTDKNGENGHQEKPDGNHGSHSH